MKRPSKSFLISFQWDGMIFHLQKLTIEEEKATVKEAKDQCARGEVVIKSASKLR